MQKDFAMFTDAGNAAVAAIVEDAVDRYETQEDAWERCYTELEKLQTVEAFSEADDTESLNLLSKIFLTMDIT